MTTILTSISNSILKASVILGFLMTQFMFYIDEGYYDLRWMLSIGNWLAFLVYFGVISLIFFGIMLVASKFSTTKTAIFTGTILGIGLILFIVFTLFRS